MRNILLLLTVILISSCKSNVSDHPDFIGNWAAKDGNIEYSINVEDNGKTEYERTTVNNIQKVKGKLKVKTDSELKIGSRSFTIDRLPRQDSITWSMIIEGIKYTR